MDNMVDVEPSEDELFTRQAVVLLQFVLDGGIGRRGGFDVGGEAIDVFQKRAFEDGHG